VRTGNSSWMAGGSALKGHFLIQGLGLLDAETSRFLSKTRVGAGSRRLGVVVPERPSAAG
jgi:hypothetical protein